MNRKVVKAILRKKFNEWVGTIEDEKIQDIVKKNSFITGGCIVSLLTNEPVNDFDVYFTDKETTRVVAKYYVKKFNLLYGKHHNRINGVHNAMVIDGAFDVVKQVENAGEEMWKTTMLEEIPEDRIKIIVRSDGVAGPKSSGTALELGDEIKGFDIEKIDDPKGEKEKYRPIFLSTNAVTLSNNMQIIIRFYGTPAEVHENFDFIHCTNYYIPSTNELNTNSEALEAILTKTLYYHGSKYPLCSIIRTRKFLKRGWNINAGQYLKMCFQLSELDLTDVYVLEDQLVGVDTAYFLQVIESLKRQQNKNPSFEITSSYVGSLIDKIF